MANIWQRFREARLLRVLIFYGAASWGLLQLTALLREEFQLPFWITPVAAILLLVGLLVLVTTGWVQAHPTTRVGGAGGAELPTPWEVDLVDLKESVVRGQLPHLTWARAILGGVVAFSLLFGFAGLYVLLTGRAPTVPGPKEAVAAAAPSIAVLPFRTVGADLELWREGMVDLLATNLDGSAGFRTSDPRTLLNRWRSQVGGEGEEPDLDVALGIARGVGASFAVMGSAVDLGSGVRISAEVYDLSTGESIGRARVEGSADSVLTLVDRLSIGVLQHVVALAPEELPRFDVREITTTSLDALRAYLAGEQRFRRGLWEEAIEDFTRALDEDSTFALAALRNSQAYGWTEGFSRRALEFSQQAERNADRLPPRAAMFIHALTGFEEQRRSSIDALEELLGRYPDYVEARYWLGEAYYHFGDRALFGAEKHRQAFLRVLELDPSYSEAYIHLIEDALARRDSADSRELLAAYSALSPGGPHAIGYNLLSDLAWGEEAVRERAMEALDTVDARALGYMSSTAIRAGAYPWEVSLPVSHALTDSRIDEENRIAGHLGLYWNYVARGRLEESRDALHTFLSMLDYTPSIAEGTASMWLSLLGYPASPPQELASKPDNFARFTNAAYAADQGRFSVTEEQIDAYELRAEEAAAQRDEISAPRYESFAQALRVHAALRRGDLPLAITEYQKPMPRLPGWASGLLRFSIGKALLEDGDAAEAEKYLKSVAEFYEGNVPSQYYLGEAYEALDEPEKARLHYASFVRWWEEADPELQPWVERARDALERLTREARTD